MTLPLISVIIPTYNHERYITDALDSIMANQYKNLQIIVVDDGSTDHTAEKVRAYPTKILLCQQENKGAPSARNRGLAEVKGDVLSFLDSDDMWTEDKLAIQLPLLENADIVIGHTSMMVNQDNIALRSSLSASLFRRLAFEVVGNFTEDMPYADDIDWMFRAREANLHVITHKEVVLRHRRHDTNLTNHQTKTQHYDMLAIKRSLERRRKSGQGEIQGFIDNTNKKDNNNE